MPVGSPLSRQKQRGSAAVRGNHRHATAPGSNCQLHPPNATWEKAGEEGVFGDQSVTARGTTFALLTWPPIKTC